MKDYIIPLDTQHDLQKRSDNFLIKNFPQVPRRILTVARGKFVYLYQWNGKKEKLDQTRTINL